MLPAYNTILRSGAQTPFLPKGTPADAGSDPVGIHPVGKDRCPIFGDPERGKPCHHLPRDAGDAVEPAHQPAFDCVDALFDEAAGNEAKAEKRLHLEILDVQPDLGIRQAGRDQRTRGTEQRRLDHENPSPGARRSAAASPECWKRRKRAGGEFGESRSGFPVPIMDNETRQHHSATHACSSIRDTPLPLSRPDNMAAPSRP